LEWRGELGQRMEANFSRRRFKQVYIRRILRKKVRERGKPRVRSRYNFR
jgi:hypothetical protein